MVFQTMAEEARPEEGTGERWSRVRPILEIALDLPAERRNAYIDDACGTDAALRAEVESLLVQASESVWFDRPVLAGPGDTSTMQTPAPPRLQPGELVGNYRVVAKIGQGGMGAVYEAVDQRLNRRVALKVILRDSADEDSVERRRFAKEARAASALNHPNIATVYEYDTRGGLDFIAMEYIQGASLDRMIDRRETALPLLLNYAAQAARAIEKAHQAGIVHRDLKPGNIMVTAEGVVKVLDFGLARLTQAEAGELDVTRTQSLTRAGAVVGTPAYMSPERVLGETEDWRGDIFSFGVILYEIACGRRPFAGKTAQATLGMIVHEDPPPSNEVNRAVPADLARLIEQCLRKAPDERPTSMGDVAEALTAITSPPLKAGGLSRRKATIGVLTMAGIAAAGLWIYRPIATPALSLTYSMEAQRMRDGQPLAAPYTASASDEFEGGWRFRLRAKSVQSGFLYVINDGPDEKGASRLWILHPREDSVEIAPGREAVTGWMVFDPNPGTEKLWVLWSRRRIEAIEGALGGTGGGRVDSPDAADSIRRLLAGLGPARRRLEREGAIRLEGTNTSGVLGEVLEIRHR